MRPLLSWAPSAPLRSLVRIAARRWRHELAGAEAAGRVMAALWSWYRHARSFGKSRVESWCYACQRFEREVGR